MENFVDRKPTVTPEEFETNKTLIFLFSWGGTNISPSATPRAVTAFL